MASPIPQEWTGGGYINQGWELDEWGWARPKQTASRATIAGGAKRSAGGAAAIVKVDMREIDLAGERMQKAAKHYAATTGYRASTLIKKKVQIAVAPELKKTIAYAASIAPRGSRSSSGRLKRTEAYHYKPVPRSKELYDYRIQAGKSKGRGANPTAKAVAPYVMFPFWQGGTQAGYNWTAPKEWLWRASERRAKHVANAARKGVESAYDTMIDAKAGRFM